MIFNKLCNVYITYRASPTDTLNFSVAYLSIRHSYQNIIQTSI